MMGAMSTELTTSELRAEIENTPYYGDINFVERVSTKETYEWTGDECSKLGDLPGAKVPHRAGRLRDQAQHRAVPGQAGVQGHDPAVERLGR